MMLKNQCSVYHNFYFFGKKDGAGIAWLWVLIKEKEIAFISKYLAIH
jgi:hypothetical protein